MSGPADVLSGSWPRGDGLTTTSNPWSLPNLEPGAVPGEGLLDPWCRNWLPFLKEKTPSAAVAGRSGTDRLVGIGVYPRFLTNPT